MRIVQANTNDANTLANIVSVQNMDVAQKFDINIENNPKHPSFYSDQWLLSDMRRGEKYFFCEIDNKII